MKNAILITILSLTILSQWGCSQKIAPFAPTAAPSQLAAPVATPQASFAAQWTYAGTSLLNTPVGIAVDGDQVVYVTDSFLGEVLKYDMNGDLMAQWGKGGSDNLDQPSGIAVHNGNVYVADSANSRVVEYDPNGVEIAVVEPKDFSGDLFAYPTGVSFDSLGNLYVSDNSDVVYQFNSALVLTAQWGNSGNTDGKFNYPVVTAEDNSGNVYVAANNSDAIFKYNTTTNLLTSWGTTGPDNGHFKGPSDAN